LKTRAFENVRDQIGFCGIWCGSCPAGNGVIMELTRKYEETVKKNNLEKCAPKEFDYKEFAKGLASIQAMSSCPGCMKGGGSSKCKIRICALGKGFSDCSSCDQLIICRNFEELEKSHPSIKVDLSGIKNENRKELVRKWFEGLREKWPYCVLFCSSTDKPKM